MDDLGSSKKTSTSASSYGATNHGLNMDNDLTPRSNSTASTNVVSQAPDQRLEEIPAMLNGEYPSRKRFDKADFRTYTVDDNEAISMDMKRMGKPGGKAYDEQNAMIAGEY